MGYRPGLRTYNLSIGERLKVGGQPTIDDIKYELACRHAYTHKTSHRINDLMVDAESFKTIINNEQIESQRHTSCVNNLFLTSVVYIGRTWLHDFNYYEHPSKKQKFEALEETIRQRTLLLAEIDQYVQLFEQDGSPERDSLLFESLSAVVTEASCLVLDRYRLQDNQQAGTDKAVRGILAEYKILRGLGDGDFPMIRYAEPTEDLHHKTDIVVTAAAQRRLVPVYIQVKSRPDLDNGLVISDITPGHLEVLVPTNNHGLKFRLSEEECQNLIKSVQAAGEVSRLHLGRL